MKKLFQRTIENFTCERCGAEVKGNGYTNHCPQCLWSKHVDVNPGDRAGKCGGMMRPVSVIKSKGEYVLENRCERCGYKKKNKLSSGDDFDAAIALNPVS